MSTAETRAFETIQKHWIDEDNKVTFPIDPYIIAERMGLRVEHRVGLPKDVSGILLKEPEDTIPLALVNYDHSETRRRFTLAHEIGHYTYIQDNEPHKLKEGIGLVEHRDEIAGLGKDKREIDANTFAANLLMPEGAVRIWVYEGKTRTQMAKDFVVSLEALGNRLNTLGLSRVA